MKQPKPIGQGLTGQGWYQERRRSCEDRECWSRRSKSAEGTYPSLSRWAQRFLFGMGKSIKENKVFRRIARFDHQEDHQAYLAKQSIHGLV